MYKNFSDASINAVMRAHRLAVEFGQAEVNCLILLLALMQESTSVAELVNADGLNEDQLKARIAAAYKKEQLVPFPIKFDTRTQSVLDVVAQTYSTVSPKEIFEHLKPFVWTGSQRSDSKTANPRSWFSPSIYSILQSAELEARQDGTDSIQTNHLLCAAAAQLDWLPQRLRTGILHKPRGAVATQTDRDLELSSECVELLCAARKRAELLAADQIEAEHIVWEALGVLDPHMKVLFVEALDEHAKKQAAARAGNQYVVIEGTRIWMAPRMVAAIKWLKHVAPSLAPRPVDYIVTLFEQAKATEVAFIANRAEQIQLIIDTMPDDATFFPLTDVLDLALSHAERLGSMRLDINHLALALLDFDNASVARAVAVIAEIPGEHAPKAALRRRLEGCLVHQRQLTDLQAHPSVEVDLADLNSI